MKKKIAQITGFLLGLIGYGVEFYWTTDGTDLHVYKNTTD